MFENYFSFSLDTSLRHVMTSLLKILFCTKIVISNYALLVYRRILFITVFLVLILVNFLNYKNSFKQL